MPDRNVCGKYPIPAAVTGAPPYPAAPPVPGSPAVTVAGAPAGTVTAGRYVYDPAAIRPRHGDVPSA